jgi:hypothetical protein
MGGTGHQDTSHLTGGSGDGGNDTKPTIRYYSRRLFYTK